MPNRPRTRKQPWIKSLESSDKPHASRKKSDPRYHTYRWQLLRKEVLRQQDYTCQECLRNKKIKHGNVCDHISISEREKDFWNPENLQCLCQRCHDRKSQAERGVRI